MCCLGGLCARHRCACGVLLAVLGTICFFSAACTTSIFQRLTPLYTAIECRQQYAGLQHLKLGMPLISPTEFDLLVRMNCTNPNPFSLSFDFTEPGTVYLGKAMTVVGQTSQVENTSSHFPADGNGPFWVRASSKINAMTLAGVATDLLSSHGSLPLRIQLRQRLQVDVSLLFGAGMAIEQLFKKDCGMMIGNLGLHPTIGPLSCADSFEELTIPPASAGSDDGVMRFAARDIAPKVLAKGAFAKNAGLGTSMAVFYLLGIICYVAAACQFWRRARERKATSGGKYNAQSEASSTESGNEMGNANVC